VPGFDEAVDTFLRAYAVPRRRREPRFADHFRDVAPTTVSTRWGDLAAWRAGSGPAVMLVHGWEDDSSLWSPLIDALVERGRAVVAFDLPGHGWSTGDWAVGFEGSDGIVAVTAALGPIDSVVAHSAGSGVAAGAIDEGWEVDRAVFIAPPLRGGDRWQRHAARHGVPADVMAAARARYYAVHGPAREAWRSRAAYAALDVDLLVIHSRDDERMPFTETQAVVAQNPRARLVLVDGLTHRRTARDPAVVELITDFVAA
jgi:pimeloyl-ACP methyl ester carboxylesterase